MLKALFSSNTRIKLLKTFVLNVEEEYFIRELTRKLDEQINSIRRELDNLKKIGLLKSKVRNRKKYYYVNKDFIILDDLKNMLLKAMSTNDQIIKKISKMSGVDLLVLSGIFVGKETQVDLLVVGDADKDVIQAHIKEYNKHNKEVKFTIINQKDFVYRLECKDKFIYELLKDEESIVVVNKLKKEIDSYIK